MGAGGYSGSLQSPNSIFPLPACCVRMAGLSPVCRAAAVCCSLCGRTQSTMIFIAFLCQQKTSSLSQLPVEDIREPLPPHWRCYMSPQGKKYYVNTANNETTWERPSSVPGTPKSSVRHKNSLPAVNGFHSGGSSLHHGDHSHNSLVRRSSTEHQSSGSTSPIKKQNKESTVTVSFGG
ncbi:hypothetical protein XENORESO_001369 [Xenotaenia resolanae]|uniref:WW domain-containing protein n=1 Tax=Xenotaenia resolanae TaxID=208358 RepID=A0ABV0VUF3_9TELE